MPGRDLTTDGVPLSCWWHVTDATVKTHVNRLLMKLDLRDRTQAVVLAYEARLVEPGDR